MYIYKCILIHNVVWSLGGVSLYIHADNLCLFISVFIPLILKIII